ncbi:hypothetical protein RK588_05120 [Streptococcus pneumoniae]|uniref:hypothetical protein n=1 Tax=Streptococcus pneumoniae TaxID=1313 RepID=UPI00076924E9|nr:hypothetical protein [Streptococcus pneumoniae]MDS3371304.1 hypothetical protein [Streptococcus pneumoniae]MDT6204193.1 hypothetical protein [Streptococcus pneumoniae]CZE14917.1 Uncharacterised protein [Streptococcus pneumoniae]CZE15932.1 Uncharacterised protein [Streptococcus pneumoniae]
MENKFVEFIENNKKVIISSVAVGVVLVLGFGWYSYNQQQAEQQAKIVQLEKDSKSDKESSKAIVDFHLQKGLAYDVKDSDEKFKDKATLEINVKEITKQIDFIKKVDETFKQENLEETFKSLNDLIDKYQKQIELLKKEEEKAAEKAKESSSQSNSSGGTSNESYNGSSNSNVDYSSSEQTNGYSNNYGNQGYSGSGNSSTNGGSSEQYSSRNSNIGANNGYTEYRSIDASGHVRDTYHNRSNGDVFDENGNYLGNLGGGIAEPPQR